jgi:hypothetical protein
MWRKVTYRNYFLASIIIEAFLALSIILLKNFLPPLVPLFYGLPAGEEQLTSTLGLLIAPGVSSLMTIVNLCISFWVKDDFIKKILAISTTALALLATITVIKIILLVGFF